MRYPLVRFSLLAGLLIIGGLSCAKSPRALTPSASDLLLPSYEDLLPDGRPSVGPSIGPGLGNGSSPSDTGMTATLATLGIRLTSEQQTQLRTLTEVQPNGRWSRSQNQTAEQNLLANYRRFNPLFTPAFESAEEYRIRALSFAEKSTVPHYLDLQYYLDNNRLLVVKWDETSGEFVVIQADGTLVNYLITRVIQPPRYLKVDL